MSFQFQNLDATTREFMVRELELDESNNNLYLSKRFNTAGISAYPALLREALQSHDEIWLANELRRRGCFKSHEETARGSRTVPVTAAETLADGEFNRFYMRGVCARAVEEEISHVVVYRAKAVSQPRVESQMLIGRQMPASTLLMDLRNSVGVDTVLGLPSGPNSGLSVRLP